MSLISVRDLTHVYPGGMTALQGLSLELEPGIIGFVGANGAGMRVGADRVTELAVENVSTAVEAATGIAAVANTVQGCARYHLTAAWWLTATEHLTGSAGELPPRPASPLPRSASAATRRRRTNSRPDGAPRCQCR